MATERTVGIGVVARETGLGRDVLRKWEERYGFPTPERSANGLRKYPVSQVEHLRKIKRLIDSGHRPNKVVAPPVADLSDDTSEATMVALGSQMVAVEGAVAQAMMALRQHDLFALRRILERDLVSRGLLGFVTRTVAELTTAVGTAWSRGELRVYHEHVYSNVLHSVLEGSRRRVSDEAGSPRILLTTAPGELHTLGLAMVESLFSDLGAQCLFLGPQTPIAEIAAAVDAYRIDLVGLSFSEAFPVRDITPFLLALRQAVPPMVSIWVGGCGCARVQRLPRGVLGFLKIEDACASVTAQRTQPAGT